MQCSLYDCVRFRVRRAHAVIVHEHAAHFRTVRHAARRSVVPGRQNAVLAYQHAAYRRARAGRARGNRARDLHEVFIPTRAHASYAFSRGRTATGTELVLPNMRSPASPSPGTM